jgi:hypothetical protein
MAVGSTIFLVGGTGQQGCRSGGRIDAARGAELVGGDTHDRASLDRAMSGVAGGVLRCSVGFVCRP